MPARRRRLAYGVMSALAALIVFGELRREIEEARSEAESAHDLAEEARIEAESAKDAAEEAQAAAEAAQSTTANAYNSYPMFQY